MNDNKESLHDINEVIERIDKYCVNEKLLFEKEELIQD